MRVHSAQNIVQQQHIGRAVQRARQTDAQFLSARKSASALPDQRRVAGLQNAEVSLETRARHCFSVALLAEGLSEENVGADCVVDDPWPLTDVGEGAAEFDWGGGTRVEFSEGGHDKRGFPAAVGADHCLQFPLLQGEVDLPQLVGAALALVASLTPEKVTADVKNCVLLV